MPCLTLTLPFCPFSHHATKSPHGSLPPQHFDALRQRLSDNNFDLSNLVVLAGNQSHFLPNLRVFNYGTPEFTALEPVFDMVDFRTGLSLDGKTKQKRGNKQVSYGFAGGQSRAKRCSTTYVAAPAMLKSTLPSTYPSFEVLSTLVMEASKYSRPGQGSVSSSIKISAPDPAGPDNNSEASFRHVKFAGQISRNNILEYVAPSLNDKDNPLIVAHADQQNDPNPGMNFAIVASRLLVDMGSSKPEIKRVLQIGSQRKSCSDYMKSANGYGTLIDALVTYFRSLPLCDRYFDPVTFFRDTIGQTRVLQGNFFVSPCNGDRCVHESLFCSAIEFYVDNGHPLGVHQVLEVALASLYSPDPKKYTCSVKK